MSSYYCSCPGVNADLQFGIWSYHLEVKLRIVGSTNQPSHHELVCQVLTVSDKLVQNVKLTLIMAEVKVCDKTACKVSYILSLILPLVEIKK